MARQHKFIVDTKLRIPEDAYTFEGFQRWVDSKRFPENGRIDFLAGRVEAEMSPEDLYMHAAVKTAMTITLGAFLAENDLGELFVDRTRVISRFANLSVEPDLVVVLLESLASGRVRHVPAASQAPDRYSALAGAPDVVVEIVSDSSVGKDTKHLPQLYAAAGVPELWLVDAREELSFQIHTLASGEYVPVEPAQDGWLRSPRLERSFQLTRSRTRAATWRYFLALR